MLHAENRSAGHTSSLYGVRNGILKRKYLEHLRRLNSEELVEELSHLAHDCEDYVAAKLSTMGQWDRSVYFQSVVDTSLFLLEALNVWVAQIRGIDAAAPAQDPEAVLAMTVEHGVKWAKSLEFIYLMIKDRNLVNENSGQNFQFTLAQYKEAQAQYGTMPTLDPKARYTTNLVARCEAFYSVKRYPIQPEPPKPQSPLRAVNKKIAKEVRPNTPVKMAQRTRAKAPIVIRMFDDEVCKLYQQLLFSLREVDTILTSWDATGCKEHTDLYWEPRFEAIRLLLRDEKSLKLGQKKINRIKTWLKERIDWYPTLKMELPEQTQDQSNMDEDECSIPVRSSKRRKMANSQPMTFYEAPSMTVSPPPPQRKITRRSANLRASSKTKESPQKGKVPLAKATARRSQVLAHKKLDNDTVQSDEEDELLMF